MMDGWGVYLGTVSIEATTVPLALHPSIALYTYAYDAGSCPRVCVLCKIIIISKQVNKYHQTHNEKGLS